MVAYLLLGVGQLVGLTLIVLGIPGVWLQLVALALFGWWSEFTQVGAIPLVILLILVSVAEILILQNGRSERDRSAQRAIGGAGMAGGIGGAVLGLGFPLLGSIAGAFLGSWVGAGLGGWRLRSRAGFTTRLLPRVASTAIRTTAGIAVAAFTFVVIAT